ncbi:MAG: DUF418 domain-containing protein [Candidatus Latescibacteria bacterium]|nr:DUF418 domain-containing protein [Candidatus Latescibacterota bacterium]
MPDASPSSAALTPTPDSERIVVLDILRGFAVLGILVVNMEYFNTPFYTGASGVERWTGTADRVVEAVITFAALGKFYTLFSFLFGLGFALQMTRANARSVPFVPLYVRRFCVLLLIGLAHTFLLWVGDILTAYALLGFLLLLFRRRSDRSLLRWCVFFLVLPILINAALSGLIELSTLTPESAAQVERNFVASAARYQALTEQSFRVYAHGTFADIMAQRIEDFQFVILRYIFTGNGPHIFASFLFGFFVGRRGWMQALPTALSRIRSLMWWSLVIGVAANTLFLISDVLSHPTRPSAMGILRAAAFAAGAPALSGFYVFALILLVHRERGSKRFAPLAAVGRLALSNYLTQSLICTTIFYSYGFGLYGTVGPAVGLALTVGIWMLQLLVSRWWVKRFRYGPAEWLWRSLTYLKLQPMAIRP